MNVKHKKLADIDVEYVVGGQNENGGVQNVNGESGGLFNIVATEENVELVEKLKRQIAGSRKIEDI